MAFPLSVRILHFRRKPPSKNPLIKHAATISSFSTFAAENPLYRNTFFFHIFPECIKQKALQPGRQAHARMILSGFKPRIYVANSLLQMYIQCSRFECAAKVFDRMPERDVISCNCMISGYLENGNSMKSIEVFLMMERHGIALNAATFSVVLKTCATLNNYALGLQLHGVVVKIGFECNVVIGTAIFDMYAKCNMLDESLRFFYAMPVKCVVSWSAIIAGHVQTGKLEGAVELFKEMQREGVGVRRSVYASVFKACAGLSDLRLGSQLHGHALKSEFGANIVVGTAILDMYAKCDDLLNARKVFDLLPNHNLLSYTALIVGYARGERGFEGMQLFLQLFKSDLGFNEISLSAAFSACAVTKGLGFGTQIHGLAIKTLFHDDIGVATAIINMYGKCGALPEARRIFDEMERRDAVTWSAIIAACDQNKNEETLSLYVDMLRSRMQPNEVTYATVLKACAGASSGTWGGNPW